MQLKRHIEGACKVGAHFKAVTDTLAAHEGQHISAAEVPEKIVKLTIDNKALENKVKDLQRRAEPTTVLAVQPSGKTKISGSDPLMIHGFGSDSEKSRDGE